MRVIYPDISEVIGYNPHRPDKPFWMQSGFNFIVVFSPSVRRAYHVPLKFQSDGCSLKHWLLRLFFGCQHTPEYLIASIVHDYFCNNKHIIPRQEASLVFRHVLIREGVSKKKANWMYTGVEFYFKYMERWE